MNKKIFIISFIAFFPKLAFADMDQMGIFGNISFFLYYTLWFVGAFILGYFIVKFLSKKRFANNENEIILRGKIFVYPISFISAMFIVYNSIMLRMVPDLLTEKRIKSIVICILVTFIQGIFFYLMNRSVITIFRSFVYVFLVLISMISAFLILASIYNYHLIFG